MSGVQLGSTHGWGRVEYAYYLMAREQLKVYRQAVLKKAFEGEWEASKLGNCCQKIQDGSRFSPKKQSPIRKDGVNTGNVTLNTLDELFSLLTSFCLIRPNQATMLPAFRKYFIQSPEGFHNLTGKMTGTAIKRIILKRIKEAKNPLPSLPEQHQIVKEIETRLSVCDKVEQSIAEALSSAEALRQSILKKAFADELLTEAEREACRREPDYEPAAVLLDRVRGERK